MGYIVYELLVGLAAATASEADPQIARKIHTAQVMTVISWCTYPVVYLFPMFGFSAAKAVVSIQVGYCVSDIISKCGVGLGATCFERTLHGAFTLSGVRFDALKRSLVFRRTWLQFEDSLNLRFQF